ncbi:MAG: dipicolinate synthase subunit DpsA [Oscillospiraceae bacterium]|nr:dipicolinate synthase subunit DpsA [Oscillospiraceae bacterium]
MKNKVVIVAGGDLRQIYAAMSLAKENEVYTVGFDNLDIVYDGSVKRLDSDKTDIKADVMILPLPASKSGKLICAPFSDKELPCTMLLPYLKEDTLVFGGSINSEMKSFFSENKALLIDYYEREELSIMNAVPTAEGAVMIALEEMPVTLFGSKVLIIGFGRISRALIPILKGFGADVSVAARRCESLAWARQMGCKAFCISELSEKISQFRLIYNTVPAQILSEKVLSSVDSSALIIDLASKPGGVDFNTAGSLGLKTVWALSLPGKTAPQTAGKIICDTIDNILTERGVT